VPLLLLLHLFTLPDFVVVVVIVSDCARQVKIQNQKKNTAKVKRQEVSKGAEQSGIIIKSQLPVKQPPTLRPSP